MLQIPPKLYSEYKAFIQAKGVLLSAEKYYLKWLRYYLDFCQKYGEHPHNNQSLNPFLKKLRSKRQSRDQRNQARHAIHLYYSIGLGEKGENAAPPPPSALKTRYSEPKAPGSHTVQRQLQNTRKDVSSSRQNSKQAALPSKRQTEKGADWTGVFDGLKNAISIRHYSPSTLQTYSSLVRKFQAFTQSKDPSLLDIEDVKRFLSWLAVEEKVSASSQNQAFNALLFVFRHLFNKEFGKVDGIIRAKRKPYIPVVLSREEVFRVVDCLEGLYKLIVSLMYGCGLRISECLSLRVQNLNFNMKILTIHDVKGKKDRTVPLPGRLIAALQSQLQRVVDLHERDCRSGFDGVFLYGQLEKKYPNAARELVWQWFFPARNLTVVPDSGERRRYHIHKTVLQKALRRAVQKAGIPKRVTSHTFRHSFASHLLQANYDIRTIQELMGHSDVRTTMIYTHTVKSTTKKEAKSPLDF